MNEIKKQIESIKDCKKRVEKARNKYKEKVAEIHFNMDKYLEKHLIKGRSNKDQRDSILFLETRELKNELKELEASLSYKQEMLDVAKLEKQLEMKNIGVKIDLNLNGLESKVKKMESIKVSSLGGVE